MSIGKILLLGALGIILALLIPLLVIWSLNTLFPVLNIPYNLSTWSAVALLGAYINFLILLGTNTEHENRHR